MFITNTVCFRVETIDGTAEATSDYKPLKETKVFEPKETLLPIDIEIIDDNVWEPDEVFFIRMTLEPDQQAVLGKHPVTQVTILNDDGMTNYPHYFVTNVSIWKNQKIQLQPSVLNTRVIFASTK